MVAALSLLMQKKRAELQIQSFLACIFRTHCLIKYRNKFTLPFYYGEIYYKIYANLSPEN